MTFYKVVREFKQKDGWRTKLRSARLFYSNYHCVDYKLNEFVEGRVFHRQLESSYYPYSVVKNEFNSRLFVFSDLEAANKFVGTCFPISNEICDWENFGFLKERIYTCEVEDAVPQSVIKCAIKHANITSFWESVEKKEDYSEALPKFLERDILIESCSYLAKRVKLLEQVA